MAALLAQTNSLPLLRSVVGTTIFPPDGGSNVVDSAQQPLKNIRGQLVIQIVASDDPTNLFCTFTVTGGFGDFPTDPTRNFYVDLGQNFNCSITTLGVNNFIVNSELSGMGGTDREYTFIFNPGLSFGPTVRQTSGNTIGNNTLTVKIFSVNVLGNF